MRAFVALLLAAAPLAAGAASSEIYSPPLPALGPQYFECTIVNVSAASQTVITEAFNSDGVLSGGPYTQTLGPGQYGGFSLPGYWGSVYCKFTVSGAATNYRANVAVLDTRPDGSTYLTVALPAQ